jgi:hypothetical protein
VEEWRDHIKEEEDLESKIQRMVQNEIGTQLKSHPPVTSHAVLSTAGSKSTIQPHTDAHNHFPTTVTAGAPEVADSERYLGFEKANGKRTWCEFSDQANRTRLTKNGWNMEWSTTTLQEILTWVNEAGRINTRLGMDAEPQPIPSHIHVADVNSRASSDPPGSRADQVDEDLTGKHENTTTTSNGNIRKSSPIQQEAMAKLHRRNPYLYNTDGTPKKPNTTHRPLRDFGKTDVTRKEVKIRRHYASEYKLPETMIRIDEAGRAFIWQHGCKLYMYNRRTTPPACEIFDDEDDFGNATTKRPNRPIHEDDEQFDQEVGQQAADAFAQGLVERLDDEYAERRTQVPPRHLRPRNLGMELEQVSGDHSLRTQPPSDEDADDEDGDRHGIEHLQLLHRLKDHNADAETKYLMGASGVPQLSTALLEALDFPNPEQTFRDIDDEHRMLMEGWTRPASRGFAPVVGPDQKQLLKDIQV